MRKIKTIVLLAIIVTTSILITIPTNAEITGNKQLMDWLIVNNCKKDLANEIISAAIKTKHPRLILVIAKIESTFNCRRRNKNCIGLMQINKINVYDLKQHKIIHDVSDLYDPPTSIRAADYILNKNKKKSLRAKLKQYNSDYGYYKKVREELICLDVFLRKRRLRG